MSYWPTDGYNFLLSWPGNLFKTPQPFKIGICCIFNFNANGYSTVFVSGGKRLIRSDTEISSFLSPALLGSSKSGFWVSVASRLRALLSVSAKRKWVAIEEMSRKSILHDIQIWFYTIKRASITSFAQADQRWNQNKRELHDHRIMPSLVGDIRDHHHLICFSNIITTLLLSTTANFPWRP